MKSGFQRSTSKENRWDNNNNPEREEVDKKSLCSYLDRWDSHLIEVKSIVSGQSHVT